MRGEVEGRETEKGRTHFKSTRTMGQQFNQQPAASRYGVGSASITEGPGGRVGNCRWLDEHGLRIES